MSDWPDNLTVAPIREWPGALTRDRRVSAFLQPAKKVGERWVRNPVPLTQTLKELDRELDAVNATNAELLVAIDAAQFKRDGRPYMNARAVHPGIILSLTIPGVGALSYPCDTFTKWEDNLRAVVLALEALRKVDRYGVTKRGEQYRGFLELEATAMPAGFSTADAAYDWLLKLVGADKLSGTPAPSIVLRKAQRITHPDQGGDPALFQRVTLAETKLRDEGIL